MSAPRRVTVGALLFSILPTLAGVALLRPASAGTGVPLGRFSFTANGAALTSSGSLAAEGGLILTDQGAATVTGSLDSSPSSKTLAVTAEPGTSLRTVLGSESLPAPPGAEAQYPGGPATNTAADTSAPADTDTADAGELTADATASVASGTGASATETMSANADDSQLSATVTSHSGAVGIAGVLDIGAVVGTVSLGYDGTGHHSTASVTVTGATVAGQPVTIDSSGVHAAGATVVPSGTLPTGAPAPVASVLAAAGITVTVLAPVMTTNPHGAYADSGAVVIHETTPDLTSGATGASSASDVTLYLGEATATLLDAAALPDPVFASGGSTPKAVATTASPSAVPATSAASVAPVVPGRSAVPGHTVTTVIPGSSPAPASTQLAAAPPAAVGPAAAPPALSPTVPQTAPAAFELLNHRLDASSALAGFGAWQLLTLGIATTAAMIARRRTEPEEEHLCPCP